MTGSSLRSPWEGLGAADLPRARSIPECWRAIASAYPDHLALDMDGSSRTYAALDRDAIQIARVLFGMMDGDAPVAVMAVFAPFTVGALLGGLLAGRIVLMLDPRDPPAEHERVLDFVGATTVLDIPDIRAMVRSPIEGPDLPDAFDPDTPSVLYLTSGTTGVPKVVSRTHGTMVIQSFDRIRMSAFAPGDRVGILNPLAFGASAVPLFAALLSGATASFYDVSRQGVDALPQWLRERRVKRVSLVPSLVRALADYDGPPVEFTRAVSLGGEAVRAADTTLIQRVFPNADVNCTFGAGEAGTVAAAMIPCGSPPVDFDALWTMPGQQVTIVDADGAVVAPGVVGEIVVAGPCVAHGYWRDPPEYAGVFSVAPDGTRRARPGDRGRLLPDGRLQLAGRVDHRIKVRGQGVDLLAVESRLVGLDPVREAVVSAVPGPGGATQLVAHVVIDPEAPVAARDLRRGLAEDVPAYAIPTRFRFAEALPRTNRDKVDRAALALDAEALVAAPVDYVAPRDDIDVRIAALFAELLVLDDVGLQHDFFELGGDSLSALELLVALEAEYRVNARDLATQPGLFHDHATVEALGDLVRTRRVVDDPRAVDGVSVRLTAPGAEDGPPVFLMPGISGNAMAVRALALRLDGRRAYSFWPHGMLERGWPDRSVELMAGRFAQSVRTVEPDGPHVLAGYSFGAYIVYEIARALEAAGRRPALVVMIDTGAKGWRARRPARADDYANRLRAVPSNADRARMLFGSVRWRVNTAYHRTTAGVVTRKLSNQFDAFRAHHERMMRRYEPTGSYGGPVLVVHGDEHRDDEPDLGWSRLLTGTITTAAVPGHHERLLREPWVEGVAHAINAALEPIVTSELVL